MRLITRTLCAATLFVLPVSAAHGQTFFTWLSGAAEAPPNASPGYGSATVTLDQFLNTMRVQVVFSDLVGTTTVVHIHCCTAIPQAGIVGVATELPSFTDFPLGVTDGVYDHTFDMTLATSFNPAFITANGGTAAGASAALSTGMLETKAYLNIHTATFPGGEIRGFLQVVPEPGTYALMASGLLALGVIARRRARA